MKWDVTKLTSSQKRIADFIEKSGEHILYFSETELAQKLHVSNATISRFWKQIGYDNFKSFKTALKDNERAFTNHDTESVCKYAGSSGS
jgi:DNA-binding MurR/RpiR family transcriptional regulator